MKLSQKFDPADAADFKIDDMAPGEYAIAIFHDENNNGKIDGFPPHEGYALVTTRAAHLDRRRLIRRSFR